MPIRDIWNSEEEFLMYFRTHSKKLYHKEDYFALRELAGEPVPLDKQIFSRLYVPVKTEEIEGLLNKIQERKNETSSNHANS